MIRAALVSALLAALALAPAALATAPPVGPLPPGPRTTVRLQPGATFVALLPKPRIAGGVWRAARPANARVARGAGERTAADGGIRLVLEGVAYGTTDLVYAVTRGETPRAYAARTFHVVVSRACPTDLLPLPANALSGAAAAALENDPLTNRPLVTAAVLAPHDTQRGPQAKAACGAPVWRRTVVVYVLDRALLPSQSASQRVLFVGRAAGGYRIWQRAH